MTPKRISRIVFQFSDETEKVLQHEELQRWLNHQMTAKPPALPRDEKRMFRETRFTP